MLTTPSFSSLGCLPPFTVAEMQLPPSHSVYIALLLCLLCAPAPWRITLPTAVPLWREPVLQPHRAATQLSDSPPRSLPLLCWHACHCCRKALLSFKARVASRHRVSQGNCWRFSSNHNANLKSSAFDQLFVYGMQLYGGSNHIQMIWNKLAQGFCSISLRRKGSFPPQFSNIFLLCISCSFMIYSCGYNDASSETVSLTCLSGEKEDYCLSGVILHCDSPVNYFYLS